MKQYVLSIGIVILILGLFSACENKMTTYTYQNEAILDIKIEKTEVYVDKLVVTFANDSLSGVEKVECYSSDFSAIEEEPEFSFKNNILTIETDKADMVSGIKVWENNIDLYFDVRYMDSESYAMLVSSWADDIGYMVNGDEDAYYTQDEKDEQKALAEIQAEAEAFAYSKLMGEWINESENTRIKFDSDGEFGRYFTVYEYENNEWIERKTMYISDLSEQDSYEAVEITLYDNPTWGCAVSFYLLYDESGMKCSYADDKFVKVK